MGKRCNGNIKAAPFGMTPSTVRAVLGLAGALPSRVEHVRIEATPLVDQPRQWCEQCEELCRPAQVARCGSPFCKLKPAATAETQLRLPVYPLPHLAGEPAGDEETTTADVPSADNAGGCEGRAPEGSSGTASGEDIAPANARQPHTKSKIQRARTPSTSTKTAEQSEEALPAARVDSRSGPAEGSATHQASAAGETLLKPASVRPEQAAEAVPAVSDQLGRPAANPASQRTVAPLAFHQRREMLNRSVAFLRTLAIVVYPLDREAAIRLYRVAGKRDPMLLEQVVEYAIAKGMEPA